MLIKNQFSSVQASNLNLILSSPLADSLLTSHLVNHLSSHSFQFKNTADPRVLILGHSFVHRLYSFIDSSSNPVDTLLLYLTELLHMKWHGIGGRTIAKVLAFDLHVVESFQPHIVILELGTNDFNSFGSHNCGFILGGSYASFAFSLQSSACCGLPDNF